VLRSSQQRRPLSSRRLSALGSSLLCLAFGAELAAQAASTPLGPPVCYEWSASLLDEGRSRDAFDPIPVLLSKRAPRATRGAPLRSGALSLTPRGAWDELTVEAPLDLVEGLAQRVYLIGLRAPCPLVVEQRLGLERAPEVELTLKSDHPVMAWADGRALQLNLAEPSRWRLKLESLPARLVIRLSPHSGIPKLSLKASGFELKAFVEEGASLAQRSEAELKLPKAQLAEAPPQEELAVSWRAALGRFGRRSLSFSGTLKVSERPVKRSTERDRALLEAQLKGVCDRLKIERVGWRATQSSSGETPPSWRYELAWRCEMSGERALLVGERWWRAREARGWSLDRGPTRVGLSWSERLDPERGGLWSAWSLVSSWPELSERAQRSLELPRRRQESKDWPLWLRGEGLSAETIGAAREQLYGPRSAARSPQPLLRSWGTGPLPERLKAELDPRLWPLWQSFSAQLHPVARYTAGRGDEPLTPLELAWHYRDGAWGETCAARGLRPSVITWERLRGGEAVERMSPRPLAHIGLRCGQEPWSLKPRRAEPRVSLEGPPQLSPIPRDAICLSLERSEAQPKPCYEHERERVELSLEWSQGLGGAWRLSWRQASAQTRPPAWPLMTAEPSPSMAAPDLLWLSEARSLERLQPGSTLSWWSLDTRLSSAQLTSRWRSVISAAARAVDGEPYVLQLEPEQAVLPLRLNPSFAAEHSLLTPVTISRELRFPAHHPRASALSKRGPKRLERAFALYESQAPRPLKEREGGGWSWRVELRIPQLSEAPAPEAWRHFIKELARLDELVDADPEVRELLEDWRP